MSIYERTPLLFVGHGNPINVLEDNEYTLGWEKIGREILPPKAIVCMSAHWLTTGSYITSSLTPDLIYDFYGFPKELYHVTYPVRGTPDLAMKIHTENPNILIDTTWGLDHGAWTVLKRMFPDASIPVIQLSIDYSEPAYKQFELVKQLKYLREQGIMFIGSGNIVHNLGMVSMNTKPYDWALEFEAKCKNLIEKGDIKSLLNYRDFGPISKMAIPTDDHYRPMLNTLALSDFNEIPLFFNQGIDLSSVSMLSFIYK